LRTRQLLTSGLDSQIAALRKLRPSRRLAEIGFFVLLWIAGIALGLAGLDATGAWHWPLRLAGILTAGLALNAFFLLSHDGHHRLLFRNARVNHAANVLLCIPLLHSPSAYRVLHELHHRFLGGPGDPDDFHNYTSDARLRWALHWVRLTIGTLVYMPLIPVVAIRRAEPADRHAIAIEYAAMIAIWWPVFAFLPMQVLLQVWLIPGVLVGYISAVRAVAQHALTPGDDPLLASRSVASNAVVETPEQIKRRDAAWVANPRDPLRQAIVQAPCSGKVREMVKDDPLVVEAFVMNDRGTLVCSMVETSDYWQGDEAKWQRTFVDGKDPFVEEPAFDASSGKYAIQVSVPIAEAGKRIGAVTLTLKLNRQEATAPKR